MLRTITVLALAFALTFTLAACKDEQKQTKTQPAPKDEPPPAPAPAPTTILCDTETELITAAGYTLYEGTGCPIESPWITAGELLVDQDDLATVYTMPWSFPFMGSNYTNIGVSTNGLVWMGATTGLIGLQIDLPTGDRISGGPWAGSGIPFIAAWNLDLTSYYCGPAASATCGALRVQSKTSPDRVVISWSTEAFDQVALGLFDEFAVVLFDTGDILYSYDSMTSDDPDANDSCSAGQETDINGYCGDFGSGISKSNGGTFIDLTNTIGHPVWTQTGKAFLFHPN